MKKLQSFKLPNRLICDDTLSYSARRVGAVLYSRRNRFGFCHKGLILLAKYAHCSVSTVRKAAQELMSAGYITSYHNRRYSEQLGRVVYARNTYVCELSFRGGFTMIPRSIMSWNVTAGTFSVGLFLCYQAGNGTRAFPSLRKIGKMLGMSHATVCRAVAALKKVGGILVQACIKVNRAFSNNSYYFVNIETKQERNVGKEKVSFLYHYFTAHLQGNQSSIVHGGGLNITKWYWYLDNENIRREKENIGHCGKKKCVHKAETKQNYQGQLFRTLPKTMCRVIRKEFLN